MSYSLTTLRRTFARRKLHSIRVAKTGVKSGGSYVGVVISSDADRQRKVLVSDWLSQSVVGGEESDLNTSEFDHGWLYLPGVPEQRPIATRGYTQAVLASEASDQAALTSTYTAAVTLRRPWTTLVTANQDIELHAKIPPLDDDERNLAGLHTLLNRALGVMGVPKRINIAAVSNQHAYSLAAYPWITSQDQLIRAVAYQPTSGFEQAPLGGTNTIRIDGNVAYFVTTGYPTASQNFSLDVWMPRSAWIKVGGTWAASTAGLVNETDEAEVDINELSLVAYYFACDELAERGADGAKGDWAKRRDEAAEQAAPFMAWQRERYDDPTDTPGWSSDGWSSISGALSSSGTWP